MTNDRDNLTRSIDRDQEREPTIVDGPPKGGKAWLAGSISAETNRITAAAVTEALVDHTYDRPVDVDAAWARATTQRDLNPAMRELFATAYTERRAALTGSAL